MPAPACASAEVLDSSMTITGSGISAPTVSATKVAVQGARRRGSHLDDHGGRLRALVVVTGQRFWVPRLCGCSGGAGKVGRSQWASCGGMVVLAAPLGCAPRGAEPRGTGTEVAGWLCRARPLWVPVRGIW